MASMSAPKKSKFQNSRSAAMDSKNQKRQMQAPGVYRTDASPTEAPRARKSHTTGVSNRGQKHTKIVVKCNCGFPNNLYLRGEGIKGLSWNKGTLMQCKNADEWIWETDTPFNHAQIKVLINDKMYEVGENHEVDCGKSITFAPRFQA